MSSFLPSDYSIDRYNGVNIDLDKVSQSMPDATQDSAIFLKLLNDSLKEWHDKGYRAIWFTVKLANSNLVPLLVKTGFDYHHAKSGYVTLVKWISKDEPNNIPAYPYTNIGVGGLVMNSKDEILVVKERYHLGYPFWKYPGGYANQGEDFGETAEREVWEETGIKTSFESVIAFRHSHRFQFKCSDIYFVCKLKPADETNMTPVKNLHEIADVCWMHHSELLPHLSPFNAFILKHFMSIRKQKSQLVCQKMDSLIGNVDVYFVEKDGSES
uniref:Nudix hydrolase domain-containing protein n=3 Tax=Tetranychus urticae TaxID=32264 RepID=T1KF24_TETUR